MPNIAKSHAYKEKEFGIYVLWKFLPAHIRSMKKNELSALGLSDPLIFRVIKIKNQTEFAKQFGVKDLGTLTDWNKKIRSKNITPPQSMVGFQKQYASIFERASSSQFPKLENALSEQKKIISLLKKENATLKRTLASPVIKTPPSKRKSRSSSNIDKPVQATLASAPPSESPASLLQKLRSIFRK